MPLGGINAQWETLEAAVSEADDLPDHARCTRQPALTAAKNVKFHSSPRRASLFIAGIALANAKWLIRSGKLAGG